MTPTSCASLAVTFTLFLTSLVAAAGDAYIIRGNERTLEEIQKTYAEMPPVQYMPPVDRWERLPRTKERLLGGGTLRVVMLGDSIVNDTSRSCWNLLVERRHPTCWIEKVASVPGPPAAGGTRSPAG